MDLKRFLCTIRVFNPSDGTMIAEHALPVNRPDPEHAAASTLATAASFTTKTEGGTAVRQVAFACTAIEAWD